MDSEAAFKCKGYRVESLLAGYLDKGSAHWKGGLVCECMGRSTIGGVQCVEVNTESTFSIYHRN